MESKHIIKGRKKWLLFTAPLIIFILIGIGACSTTPTPQLENYRIAQVYASRMGGTMVITECGQLWGWGGNLPSNTPMYLMGDVVEVASSGMGFVTVALKEDGSLWGWGPSHNRWDWLGDNREIYSLPIHIMDDVIAVSTGGNTTMAIQTDGSLWAWGVDFGAYFSARPNGVLGTGGAGYNTPTHVMDGVVAVSSGFGHVVALKKDGSLWAWGRGNSVFLDDETRMSRIPIKIIDGLEYD